MPRQRPSTRWTSFETWRYDGMDARLETFMNSINKDILISHARSLTKDDSMDMSEPFSAGQYWCCFELFSTKTEQLLIARVRLPRHPAVNGRVNDQSELYSIQCEVATMRFLQAEAKHVRSPRLFAYEGPGSNWAQQVGASYMMIEGFYGNTLQDVEFDISKLKLQKQQHIITQWTMIQAELATFTFPQIGSLCDYSSNGQVTIGSLAVAEAELFTQCGPFKDAYDYFLALADARLCQLQEVNFQGNTMTAESALHKHCDLEDFGVVGVLVFGDIVRSTTLFKSDDRSGPFHLNHMDIGTQNILVDDDFNILAVIDWEFAQTAPWEVNHFPMPFPLLQSDSEIEDILADPTHVAHHNVTRQAKSRQLYEQGFAQAEQILLAGQHPPRRLISKTLSSPAARIIGALEKLGVFPGMEEELTYEMIRLAFGLVGNDAAIYVEKIKSNYTEGLIMRREDS